MDMRVSAQKGLAVLVTMVQQGFVEDGEGVTQVLGTHEQQEGEVFTVPCGQIDPDGQWPCPYRPLRGATSATEGSGQGSTPAGILGVQCTGEMFLDHL